MPINPNMSTGLNPREGKHSFTDLVLILYSWYIKGFVIHRIPDAHVEKRDACQTQVVDLIGTVTVLHTARYHILDGVLNSVGSGSEYSPKQLLVRANKFIYLQSSPESLAFITHLQFLHSSQP